MTNRQRVLLLGIAAVVTATTVVLSRADGWVEYTPVAFNSGPSPGYFLVPELNTPEHRARLAHVLDAYGSEYQVRDGRLFIRRGLAENPDLLMNYTSKAEHGLR